MIVNKAALLAVFTNLNVMLNKSIAEAPKQDWEDIAMTVPSQSSEEDYGWLSDFPQMIEWIGEKQVKTMEAFEYALKNKKWESTIGVKIDDIKDDKLGMLSTKIQTRAWAAKAWPARLMATLQNGSFTGLCYDGQYFYDTDHPVKGASVSNRLSVALSAATCAAATASYGAARTAMMAFTDEDGELLGLIPDTLEVPPALEAVARILLEKDKLVDNSPNPFQGTAKVKVNPRLTSSTAWFLHMTTAPIKPFIFQLREAPHAVEQTGMDADSVFMRGEALYGLESRGNAGYGLWKLSVGSTGA